MPDQYSGFPLEVRMELLIANILQMQDPFLGVTSGFCLESAQCMKAYSSPWLNITELLYLLCIFVDENASDCSLLVTLYITRHFCQTDPQNEEFQQKGFGV